MRVTIRELGEKIYSETTAENYALRQAALLIESSMMAAQSGVEALRAAGTSFWREGRDLRSRETETEALLRQAANDLALASQHAESASELVGTARTEIDLRQLDEEARRRANT
jgi:hypothetical protein